MTRPEPWDRAYEQIAELTRRVEALEKAAKRKRCGAAQPGDMGGWYDCDRKRGHEGPHECDGVEWCDPEPVPEWRRLVDEVATEPLHGTALGAVLYHLSRVANPQFHNVAEELAKIIAVCEAQVGDGWQVIAPVRIHGGDFNVWSLAMNFTVDDNDDGPNRPCWESLAEWAAGWLRDLTEDAS